jgi:hypothetical protein
MCTKCLGTTVYTFSKAAPPAVPKKEGRMGNPQLNALKSTGVGCRFLEICSQIDFLEIA